MLLSGICEEECLRWTLNHLEMISIVSIPSDDWSCFPRICFMKGSGHLNSRPSVSRVVLSGPHPVYKPNLCFPCAIWQWKEVRMQVQGWGLPNGILLAHLKLPREKLHCLYNQIFSSPTPETCGFCAIQQMWYLLSSDLREDGVTLTFTINYMTWGGATKRSCVLC